MKSTLLAVCALVLATSLAAQRTLVELQREFAATANQLAAAQPSREQRDDMLKAQVAELERFLAKDAKGDDRWNGRLMLADLQLVLGRREAAATALQAIDAASAPALLLVTAATMAQHLGNQKLRDDWIDKALAKDSVVADKMAMARLLMVVLHQSERADKLLADSLRAAATDEDRAFVRWHRADMLRDREDLPENTGFEELDKLASDLPDTYWGSVAADRLRATRLAPGDLAIDFSAETLDGKQIALRDLRGKAVMLAFWSAADFDLPHLLRKLGELRKKHGKALAVVSICLDRSTEAITAAVRQHGIDFPVIGTGKGIETDAALRWFVEGPTLHVIDRDGKVRALGLHCGTADAREQVSSVVAATLR